MSKNSKTLSNENTLEREVGLNYNYGHMEGLPFMPSDFDDLKLHPAEKSVYLHLLRRAGRDGTAWPGIPSIAEHCRISPLLVRPILKRLVLWQMIGRQERKGRSDLFKILPRQCWSLEPRPKRTTRDWKPSEEHTTTPSQIEEVSNMRSSSDRVVTSSSKRAEHPSSKRVDEGTPNKVHQIRESNTGGNADTDKKMLSASSDGGEIGRNKTASNKYPPDFEDFWRAYPKKVGKAGTFKRWKAKKKNHDLPALEILLSSVRKQTQSEQWRKDNGQYIPNPETWLNHDRWEDEGITFTTDESDVEAAKPKIPGNWKVLRDRYFGDPENEMVNKMVEKKARETGDWFELPRTVRQSILRYDRT